MIDPKQSGDRAYQLPIPPELYLTTIPRLCTVAPPIV
jgi:hypothetical protein